jgi:predicted Zn-dependent peptidase
MKNIFAVLFALTLSSSAWAFETLKNGAPFFATQSPLPRNVYILSFQGGPSVLAPEKQGVIQILTKLFEEGPSNMTVSEYQNQLFKLGADIFFGSRNNGYRVIMNVPPESEEKAFALLRQTLQNPKLGKSDFQRIHGNLQASLRARFEDMRTVLFYAAGKNFMSYAPLTLTGDTSPNSFDKITYEDLKTSLPKILNYEAAFFAYIGTPTTSSAKQRLESVFEKELKTPYKAMKTPRPSAPVVNGLQYTVIDKPGATDNQILFLFPQKVQRDAAEWADASIAMDLLGGGLHGQLGATLRSKRGLTYAANSGFNGSGLPYWNVWTFGGVKQTKDLLTGVPEVVASFQKMKLNQATLDQSKARLRNEFRSSQELPKDRLGEETWYYLMDLNPNFIDQYEKDLTKTPLKQINQFKSQLQSKNAAVYVMGDKDVLLGILESIGVKKDAVRVLKISDIL